MYRAGSLQAVMLAAASSMSAAGARVAGEKRYPDWVA